MDSVAFEELLVSCLEQPSKKNLDNLLAALRTAGNPIPAEIIEQLNLLWEAWGDDELDDAQGAFCVGLAALPMTDSPIFRKMLVAGVKTALPPYLGRNPVMKALGVRDENVPLAEVSARLQRLLALKSGMVLFLPSSGRWCTAGAIDNINASLAVSAFGLTGGSAAIPLDIILRDAVILSPGPELSRLVGALKTPISSRDFRAIVARRAVVPVSDAVMQQMAQAGCVRNLDKAAFDKYWSSETPAGPVAGTRRSCDGRSLKEVDLLLTNEEERNAGKFSDEEASGFRRFFENLKSDTAVREAKLLASIISRLHLRSTPEQLREICTPLLAKAPFWPANPSRVPLSQLSVWGELPAKQLESLAAATAVVFPEEYLAECAMRLPLKSLNSVCAGVSEELLFDCCCEHKVCSADLLLWIWKNRKKRPSEELLGLINVENTARALSADNLPKAWGAAIRELRSLLLDNVDFQKQLLEAAHGDAMMFAAVLQGALFLSPGERQSLMVKLSRISPMLRDYLENGAGQRILKAGIGVAETREPVTTEPNYTSVKSHKRLMKELDDIINIHVPENREALKVARAHGDFRENSEFDAAKERRNFLSRRRSELERELARIQPINLRAIKVEDSAVIGSEIELRYDDGEAEVYQLLGAWDGDPERKFLSYRTRLGAAVLNRRQGETFEVPGGRKCTLVAVRPLSAEIIAELDE